MSYVLTCNFREVVQIKETDETHSFQGVVVVFGDLLWERRMFRVRLLVAHEIMEVLA
jgi:hypothetical protein